MVYNQDKAVRQEPEWLAVDPGGNMAWQDHLAAAIANFALAGGLTLFITVSDLLDTLRFAYSDPSTSFRRTVYTDP